MGTGALTVAGNNANFITVSGGTFNGSSGAIER